MRIKYLSWPFPLDWRSQFVAGPVDAWGATFFVVPSVHRAS